MVDKQHYANGSNFTALLQEMKKTEENIIRSNEIYFLNIPCKPCRIE